MDILEIEFIEDGSFPEELDIVIAECPGFCELEYHVFKYEDGKFINEHGIDGTEYVTGWRKIGESSF